ncbi:MAG: hypothetical protein L0331_05900 [Chloroflexi bacterium]|nr:hypothetical protein [Chloroflexota bacterium]
MPGLAQRIALVVKSREWLNDMATQHHYMHRPVHYKACPFGWSVTFDDQVYQPDGKPSGFILFSSVHFTRLTGEFGYPGLPTRWQVLQLSRLWLHDNLPRNSETCTIAKALRLVQRRWLEVHPPRDPAAPYHIVKVISFADTRFHEGTIYKAANFRAAGETTSQKRHRNTRGPGLGGAKLKRFIYDLKPPRWIWQEVMGLPLFEGG